MTISSWARRTDTEVLRPCEGTSLCTHARTREPKGRHPILVLHTYNTTTQSLQSPFPRPEYTRFHYPRFFPAFHLHLSHVACHTNTKSLRISTVKPTRYTNVSNLFYFWMTLYMFRTIFPSIISSSILYIQQQAFVKQLLVRGYEMEFHLVPYSKQTAVSVWQMPLAVCTVLYCWWWTERPSETCRVSFQNKINLIHWCI